MSDALTVEIKRLRAIEKAVEKRKYAAMARSKKRGEDYLTWYKLARKFEKQLDAINKAIQLLRKAKGKS